MALRALKPSPKLPLPEPLAVRGGGAVLSDEDAKRLTGPGLRAFFNIASAWGLTVEEQMRLLDLDGRSTLFNWKKEAPARLNRDRLERISHVHGIYKALRILFPTDELADGWPRLKNLDPWLFNGRSAVEVMVQGGISGLQAVRSYLDAHRGGWA